jgi:hypothetical protein
MMEFSIYPAFATFRFLNKNEKPKMKTAPKIGELAKGEAEKSKLCQMGVS